MPTAEQYFAAMDAEAKRFAAARALVCPPEGCEYDERVGVVLGGDVDIDGGIYPGSPFDAHIAGCAADGWPKPRATATAEPDGNEET